MKICLLLITLLLETLAVKKNVLFIVIDDLRPALGVYGDKNAHTPNIDELASKSFVFTNAFAQQALCAPSRNSFLTSRRPDSLHLYDFYSYWRDSVGNFTTIPQHFRENGYFTQSIGKVFHPGISSNFTDDSLYSWSGVPFHPKTEIYKEAKVCPNPDGSLGKNLLCPVLVEEQPEGTLPDLESVNKAIDFINNRDRITGGKPYFLAVGFHKPHVPFKFPSEYLDYHPVENVSLPKNLWRPPLMPSVSWNPWLDVKSRDDIKKLNITFPFGIMPKQMIMRIIQNYNAATTYIDDLIGHLLRKIELNNTIIILVGDHGWSRGEHGEFSKYSNFDIATRVPLIIYAPKLSHSEIIMNNLVELVDLFPTLVDLTQVSSKLEICNRNRNNSKLCTEGTSLFPSMLNKISKQNKISLKKSVFSQYPRAGYYPTKHPDSDRPKLQEIQIMGYSIRTQQYRYTEWVQFNHTSFKPDWKAVFGTELYDHQIDPDENLNLFGKPELNHICTLLRKQLILGWRYA